MTTARQALSDVLTAALPDDIRLMPYARDIDAPDRPTVMLQLTEVSPSGVASGVRDYQFGLFLCPRTTGTGTADDELDALLEQVLYAIETGTDGVHWTKATRVSFNNMFPAYEVALIITTLSKE